MYIFFFRGYQITTFYLFITTCSNDLTTQVQRKTTYCSKLYICIDIVKMLIIAFTVINLKIQ